MFATMRYAAPFIVNWTTTCVELGCAHVWFPGGTIASTVPSRRPNASVSAEPNVSSHAADLSTESGEASMAASGAAELEPHAVITRTARARTGRS